MAKQYEREGISVEDALKIIKAIPLHALDSMDIAFLRARESYLTDEDRGLYADIMNRSSEEVSVSSEEGSETVDETPVKKTRRTKKEE